MPITIGQLSDEDLALIDAVSCNFGVRVGSMVANGMRKLYINDENVGYTLTYVHEAEFNEALDSLWRQYEGEDDERS